MLSAGSFQPLPQVAHAELLTFLLQLVLLLSVAMVLGRLAVRWSMPSVVGELLAGVLLGPSVLGAAFPGAWDSLFPHSVEQSHMLDAVAQLGVLLLVGFTGSQLDLQLVRRRGADALRVSLGGLCLPLGLGIAVGFFLPAELMGTSDRATFAFFIGVALCVSAIPVIAKTLSDLGLMHRDVGQLTLTAGMVDDAVAWLLLSVVSAMATGAVHGWEVASAVGVLAAVIAGCALVGRPLVRALLRRADRSSTAGATSATAVAVILGGAAATQFLGLEPVFGAFVAGVLLGKPLADGVVSPVALAPLRTFVMSVGAPVFLATAGLRIDLSALADPAVLLAGLGVLAVAVIGKFGGAYLGGRLSRIGHRESMALGAGLNARGVVEVVMALAGLRLGVLTTASYTIIVLIAVMTSLMAPPLLRWAMAGIEHTPAERIREQAHAMWVPGAVAPGTTAAERPHPPAS
ncbi:cation:proton antiporter [Blastococcus sp. KM273128]|uniref:cation:proton antiporter n=1 Tax=Blastococcus sp. KM273128 TaxID=2570314 RepID=UPI001F176FD2|nr:cation:proton antiporter [Blastococcus sp. KM273128]MCF6744052.1 cation:proton antiporter [Blastococcus sp. KM273128]